MILHSNVFYLKIPEFGQESCLFFVDLLQKIYHILKVQYAYNSKFESYTKC